MLGMMGIWKPCRVVDFGFFKHRPCVLWHQSCSNGASLGPSVAILPGERLNDNRHVGGHLSTIESMSKLCKAGRLKEAMRLLSREGYQVDYSTYAALLQSCTKVKSLADGKRVHDHIIRAGIEPDGFLGNLLISMYAKCGSVVDSYKVFTKMPRRDVVSWNSMIAGFAQHGFKKEAFELFQQIRKEGVMPNKVTYVSILTACSSPSALESGKQVHAEIIRSGYEQDARVANSLLSMYGRCGSVHGVRQVFEIMSTRDVISYNTVIGLYAQQDLIAEALKYFGQLQQEGIEPDKVTYINILTAFDSPRFLKEGKRIHSLIIRSGYISDVSIGTALVSMYTRCGDIESAKQVFETIPTRDVVSWNALIVGLARQGLEVEAFELYYRMRADGVTPNRSTFMSMLTGCASSEALEVGEIIHTHIMESGLESDLHLRNALLSMYARCGSLARALQVFHDMPKRDVVSWNALIAGYAQQCYVEETFKLFHQMQVEGVKPDKVTFTHILCTCADPAVLKQGKRIHDLIIRNGLELVLHVGNALISMYARCGSLTDALKVFKEMPTRDVVSWNAMIAGCAQHGSGDISFKLYQEMDQEGIKPDAITFNCILDAFASPAAFEQGKSVHADILKSGLDSDISVSNALISMYTRCGSLEDARQVFHNMPRRDVKSWTALVAGYADHGHEEEAFRHFWQMQREGLKPNKTTFSSILKACASSACLEEGKKVLAYIFKSGYELEIGVGNALISSYSRCGSILDARQVFDRMSARDVVSWNKMIAGYAQHDYDEDAFELFHRMEKNGIEPNNFTFISILDACATLEEGKRMHSEIVKRDLEQDVRVGTALISMYTRSGALEDAQQVFDNIHKHNVVSWNAMILGYAQHGLGKEALMLFRRMQVEGFKPDGSTFIGILSACNHAGLADEGHSIFLSMEQAHGIAPTGEHYGCLVGLLGRVGQLSEAEVFINRMPLEPDATLWMTLLGACRLHGNVKLAERAADGALKLGAQNAAVYVMLSNVYAAAGRWDDVVKVRNVMEQRGVKKEPGRSWIEVHNTRHEFVAEDRSHPQTEKIYNELERLNVHLKKAGYVPDTHSVLHDMNDQQRKLSLCYHSERLAIAYGLISMPPGHTIRIFKNLRICGDCHTATKFISKILNREIIARDSNRFHRFHNGICSCNDYW